MYISPVRVWWWLKQFSIEFISGELLGHTKILIPSFLRILPYDMGHIARGVMLMEDVAFVIPLPCLKNQSYFKHTEVQYSYFLLLHKDGICNDCSCNPISIAIWSLERGPEPIQIRPGRASCTSTLVSSLKMTCKRQRMCNEPKASFWTEI